MEVLAVESEAEPFSNTKGSGSVFTSHLNTTVYGQANTAGFHVPLEL